jgi:hypothetical protein
MIRPLTILSVVAAAGAGLHVYNTKHAVFLLDRELRTFAQGIQEADTRTQALRAEWSWATEQERLRGLAQRHLALEPMQPTQFVRFADAERRLPAPEAWTGPVERFGMRAPAPGSAAPTRIALLPPEPAAPAGGTALAALPATAAPVLAAVDPLPLPPPAAPDAAPLSAPVLAAVAQAALAAAAAPLPLPAPAAPDLRAPARSQVAFAAPPSRAFETRLPESRTVAADLAARIALPSPPRPAAMVPPPPVRAAALPAPRPAADAVAPPPPRPQFPAHVAVASAAARMPTHVAVAAVAPRTPDGATSLGAFGVGFGGGSALGSARAALPPPVAFGAAGGAFTR